MRSIGGRTEAAWPTTDVHAVGDLDIKQAYVRFSLSFSSSFGPSSRSSSARSQPCVHSSRTLAFVFHVALDLVLYQPTDENIPAQRRTAARSIRPSAAENSKLTASLQRRAESGMRSRAGMGTRKKVIRVIVSSLKYLFLRAYFLALANILSLIC